jgi:hypothetical protein
MTILHLQRFLLYISSLIKQMLQVIQCTFCHGGFAEQLNIWVLYFCSFTTSLFLNSLLVRNAEVSESTFIEFKNTFLSYLFQSLFVPIEVPIPRKIQIWVIWQNEPLVGSFLAFLFREKAWIGPLVRSLFRAGFGSADYTRRPPREVPHAREDPLSPRCANRAWSQNGAINTVTYDLYE